MKTERHERKEGKKRLWGPMKGEPNERGQTDDSPNLILKKLLQKPSLLVNTPCARKEGGRGRKKREGKKEGNKGAPSYDTSVQGHTRKEGLPAMTKASRDIQERKKERGRERERREKEKGRCSQLRTSVQGHTIEREG